MSVANPFYVVACDFALAFVLAFVLDFDSVFVFSVFKLYPVLTKNQPRRTERKRSSIEFEQRENIGLVLKTPF